MQNTCMPLFVASEKVRLDRFLASQMADQSRTRIAKLIESGEVLVNGKPALKSGHALSQGDEVEAPIIEDREPHDLTPHEMELDIAYEDDVLIIINKPRGLASHPAASLKEPSLVNVLLARGHALSQEAGAFRPGIVHRLDRETTGLMVVAKTDAAHRNLAKQIQNKTAQRRYAAVVEGLMEPARCRVEAPIARDPARRTNMKVDPKGRPAATEFKVLAHIGGTSLVACKLETGRTHQIRVHLQSIGYPVAGDPVYGRPSSALKVPLQLHAAYLEVAHPLTGEEIRAFRPPPADFIAFERVTEPDLSQW